MKAVINNTPARIQRRFKRLTITTLFIECGAVRATSDARFLRVANDNRLAPGFPPESAQGPPRTAGVRDGAPIIGNRSDLRKRRHAGSETASQKDTRPPPAFIEWVWKARGHSLDLEAWVPTYPR